LRLGSEKGAGRTPGIAPFMRAVSMGRSVKSLTDRPARNA
jgi:hypothetical protein